MAGPIRISILANASQARKEVGGLGSTFSKVLGAAGLALGGAAIVGGIKSIVSAASDAQQSLGGTQAVFGKYADTVIKRSAQAADAYGLSANQYRESSDLIGSLLKNQGVAMDQLAGKTDKLVGLGSDLAATYGGTTADAVEALSSAFKGEFDPLEKYGISLKQSTVTAEAFRVAHVKTQTEFNKLTVAQQRSAQQQATNNLLMKQSADAQGQFQKQTNTLAEQQQILGAKFDNIKVTLGTFLLPILTKVFEFISDKGLPAAADLGSELQDKFAPALDDVESGFSKVKPLLTTVVNFIKRNPETVTTFATVLGVLAVAIGVATVAAAAFSAALDANPISLAVLAIAALAAAFVYAYKKSETFRTIVQIAMDTIKVAFKVFWAVAQPIFKLWLAEIKAIGAIARWLWDHAFEPAFRLILGIMGTLMAVWAKLLGALGHVPGFGWAKDAAADMQDAADKARDLASRIHDIPTSKSVDVVINIVRGVTYTTGGHVPADPGSPTGSKRPGARGPQFSVTSQAPIRQTINYVTVQSPVAEDPYTTGERVRSVLDVYDGAA